MMYVISNVEYDVSRLTFHMPYHFTWHVDVAIDMDWRLVFSFQDFVFLSRTNFTSIILFSLTVGL